MAVFRRHPDHLGSDDCGKVKRKIVDNVHSARVLDRIEQAVDRRFNALPNPLDHARRKGLADQAAQPCMLGRIGVEQPNREVLLERLESGPDRLGQGIEVRPELADD